MLKSFIVFGRFFLFWICFFFLDRLIFLIYFADSISNIGFKELSSTFLYALRLDASMTAYLSVIPLLIYLILLFFPKFSFPSILAKTYVSLLIITFSIISAANLNLYREWGSKINYRAVDLAFNSTKEAIASSSSSPIFLSVIIILTLIITGYIISRKLVLFSIPSYSVSIAKKTGITIISLCLTFLLLRGGWQLSPINQSMAYFSTKSILNHAAVNTEWNLMQDILNNKYGNDNPYKYYNREEAKNILKELFGNKEDNPVKILKSPRPNIILIILESFTAELVGSLNGEKGVSPNLDALSRDGILFENIYAAAGRTDKGVTATLSAFPSQAIRSIMKQNSKQEKLPGIAQDLAQNSYQTSFYYGGESEFFNMKSYILSHGYQKMTDQYSFSPKDMNSKWGTYDDKVFSKNLKDLDHAESPFFSTILTLTNHEPFELPGKARFKGDNVENRFRSTTFYTDSCLGAYIREARQKNWYKNTLFIVIADHSHRLPENLTEFDPKRYRIPMLFFGDAVKPEFRGTRISKYGNQTDLASTLLSQLNISDKRYPWSKDLLNPKTPGFGFFNWDNGFGFATEEQIISFDNVGKNIILRKNNADPKIDAELTKKGKAYMQEVFQQYLDF